MARVLLDHVSKLYDKTSRPAVDRVSLEVHDEEFVVLVGPSGCGKTTTLRMIAGLEEISSGEITIGDRVVNNIAPSQRDIAMIFQNYALYPHFTVYKNIAFPLKNRRVPRAEIDKRVREVAQKLGLIDLLDRKPRQLSGGQRQRVAVGRAMVRDPAVFLFDEPLSNLDAKMRVTMRNEIKRLHRDLNATMVYVTHDQVEAMTMGDRIVVMNDGRVQQIDDPKTLYDRPQNMFVAGFIGSPPMNLLEGRIETDGAQMRFRGGPVEFSVPAPVREKIRARKLDSVVFGIRPEDAEELPRLGAGRDGTDESDWATFEGKVLNRETLGHEVVLYLDAGMEALVARVSSESPAAMGERHKLYLNLGKSHFFDPSSGERI